MRNEAFSEFSLCFESGLVEFSVISADAKVLHCLSRRKQSDIFAVGGVAGTSVTRTTTPDGTQELRLTLEPQHAHTHTHTHTHHTNKEIRDG